jgi:hypothetical protein
MDIWSKKWLMSFNPDKTEIMIFSNRSIPENLDFSFNGISVPITTSHKHLGATFSNDAKWSTHVDNIQSSVSKHLNILCRLNTGTCFIQKIYAPSSSLLQGKHLPFSPSPLRLNIFRLFVILSLT